MKVIHDRGSIVSADQRSANYAKEYTGPVCALCSKPAKLAISGIMFCVACYREHQADVTGQGRPCAECGRPFNTDIRTKRLCDSCRKKRPYNNRVVREG